jgi:hypothetical protein
MSQKGIAADTKESKSAVAFAFIVVTVGSQYRPSQ